MTGHPVYIIRLLSYKWSISICISESECFIGLKRYDWSWCSCGTMLSVFFHLCFAFTKAPLPKMHTVSHIRKYHHLISCIGWSLGWIFRNRWIWENLAEKVVSVWNKNMKLRRWILILLLSSFASGGSEWCFSVLVERFQRPSRVSLIDVGLIYF